MFDYMFSADIFVDDMRRQSELLVRHLGLRPPSDKAIVTDSPEAHATMFRLQRSFAAAPTRLEIIQPAQAEGHWNCAHIQQAWWQQRKRAVRFHNVVLVGDTEALAKSLERKRVPYVVDRSVAFERLWVGICGERIDHYYPAFDAGLRIEVLSSRDFPVAQPTPADLQDPQPLARVVARSFIVEDLEASVRTLESTLGWAPSRPIRFLESDGVHSAVYSFAHSRSADLELLQVDRAGSAADLFARRNGAGPYTLSLLASELPAWADRLRESGVEVEWLSDHEDHGQRLAIEPGAIGPVRIEMVSSTSGRE